MNKQLIYLESEVVANDSTTYDICDSLRIGFCDIFEKNILPFLINIKTVLTF